MEIYAVVFRFDQRRALLRHRVPVRGDQRPQRERRVPSTVASALASVLLLQLRVGGGDDLSSRQTIAQLPCRSVLVYMGLLCGHLGVREHRVCGVDFLVF